MVGDARGVVSTIARQDMRSAIAILVQAVGCEIPERSQIIRFCSDAIAQHKNGSELHMQYNAFFLVIVASSCSNVLALYIADPIAQQAGIEDSLGMIARAINIVEKGENPVKVRQLFEAMQHTHSIEGASYYAEKDWDVA